MDELHKNSTIEVSDEWKEEVGYRDNFRDILLNRRQTSAKRNKINPNVLNTRKLSSREVSRNGSRESSAS